MRCAVVARTVHLKINEQKTPFHRCGMFSSSDCYSALAQMAFGTRQRRVVMYHPTKYLICNLLLHSYTSSVATTRRKTPSTFFRVTPFICTHFLYCFSWIRTKLTTRKMYTQIQRNLLHPCQHINIIIYITSVCCVTRAMLSATAILLLPDDTVISNRFDNNNNNCIANYRQHENTFWPHRRIKEFG